MKRAAEGRPFGAPILYLLDHYGEVWRVYPDEEDESFWMCGFHQTDKSEYRVTGKYKVRNVARAGKLHWPMVRLLTDAQQSRIVEGERQAWRELSLRIRDLHGVASMQAFWKRGQIPDVGCPQCGSPIEDVYGDRFPWLAAGEHCAAGCGWRHVRESTSPQDEVV